MSLELSGLQFKNRQLIKLTYEDYIHHNYEFKDGLNVDPVPFNPTGQYTPGGFYLTYLDCWLHWVKHTNCKKMHYVWDVTIPDDSRVYIESDIAIKADKIILSNKRLISELPEYSEAVQLSDVTKT
jgi:hypothetical protein